MARQNYFNTLTMAQKLEQLGQCRFMDRSEFNGVERLRGKKVVIVGCGAQGLNQGLNMRDSGLDVTVTGDVTGVPLGGLAHIDGGQLAALQRGRHIGCRQLGSAHTAAGCDCSIG